MPEHLHCTPILFQEWPERINKPTWHVTVAVNFVLSWVLADPGWTLTCWTWPWVLTVGHTSDCEFCAFRSSRWPRMAAFSTLTCASRQQEPSAAPHSNCSSVAQTTTFRYPTQLRFASTVWSHARKHFSSNHCHSWLCYRSHNTIPPTTAIAGYASVSLHPTSNCCHSWLRFCLITSYLQLLPLLVTLLSHNILPPTAAIAGYASVS